MIVMDASAAVLGLLNAGDTRAMLSEQPVVCPHLADSEVAHARRAQLLRGNVDVAETLEAPLVTADARLARAPGPRCAITVLKR